MLKTVNGKFDFLQDLVELYFRACEISKNKFYENQSL